MKSTFDKISLATCFKFLGGSPPEIFADIFPSLAPLILISEADKPAEIADGGVLLPFGGYKGSGIAMMVELLAGALVGDNFSFETAAKDNNDGGPPSGGEFILAICPDKTAGTTWQKHAEEFFEKMKSMGEVRLPGERRHKNRQDTGPRNINEELVNKIKSLS